MANPLPILTDILVVAILAFSGIAIAFLVLLVLRMMRAPSFYYPPKQKIEQLVTQLMCPRCGSRSLKHVGQYTLRCAGCGFTFNLGALKLRKKK